MKVLFSWRGDELTKGLIIKLLVKVEVVSVYLDSLVCQ
jgi:hypothetical protein